MFSVRPLHVSPPMLCPLGPLLLHSRIMFWLWIFKRYLSECGGVPVDFYFNVSIVCIYIARKAMVCYISSSCMNFIFPVMSMVLRWSVSRRAVLLFPRCHLRTSEGSLNASREPRGNTTSTHRSRHIQNYKQTDTRTPQGQNRRKQYAHASITSADKDESHALPSDTSEKGRSSAIACQGRTNPLFEKKRKTQTYKKNSPDMYLWLWASALPSTASCWSVGLSSSKTASVTSLLSSFFLLQTALDVKHSRG